VLKGKKLIERGCIRNLSVHGEIYIVGYRIGARGGAVVEALRYKPEDRRIDSRWCNWNFSFT
jgi:hypothetical protein